LSDKITIIDKTLPRIEILDKPKDRIDPIWVAEQLGAEPMREDLDIEFMYRHELKDEIRRLRLIDRHTKKILQTWANMQGHDRCWWYPELFEELARIHDVEQTVEPCLPPREDFEHGCRAYQDEQYGVKKKTDKSLFIFFYVLPLLTLAILVGTVIFKAMR